MTDESAKSLAEAMNRLASAIERISGNAGELCNGIQVWHHGQPNYQQNYQGHWNGGGNYCGGNG